MVEKNLKTRLELLKVDALKGTTGHMAEIKRCLHRIDVLIEEMQAMGLDVTPSWPYGRGSASKASNTQIKVSMRVDVV